MTMQNHILFGADNHGEKAKIGDVVHLQRQVLTVVECEETHVPMLNIDADQLSPGDLSFIKSLGLTISNPDTERPVALGVDYTPESFGDKVRKFFDEDEDDDDEDDFFSGASTAAAIGIGTGLFGGSSSFGGFGGGGFGGFGGGSFAGGGASGSF